ncbi:MAG: sugar phosphate isomerase/epimerase family protein [Planctomycetota bacterium]|nr:sugar phosphate isomerase/epimerase family protein [Planctomycetota bacterium]
MHSPLTRRHLLKVAGATTAGAVVTHERLAAQSPTADEHPFGYCLNTSTIQGQKVPLTEQVRIAASAGYSGIEIWLRDLDKYLAEGGSLPDLKKQIEDLNLSVESAIGFATWIVDDPSQRQAGLEQARRDMANLRQIGGKRIAAPPAGATKQTDLNLLKAAARYRALLEVGRKEGVVPQVELWGFSQSLHRLGELLYVAAESGAEDACLLPDVYHLYKGGSSFAGLHLISGKKIHVFHVNDYPATPSRETITDAHRVYPGDGVAPLTDILKGLWETGFRGTLSLELFNRDYWKQDPLSVARTGLAKMKQSVRQAFS